MNLINYIIYGFILYLTYIIISSEYSIMEHIKKDTIINSKMGGNYISVGDWKFISVKNDPCEKDSELKCDKLFMQDPEGSKFLIKESESVFQKTDLNNNNNYI